MVSTGPHINQTIFSVAPQQLQPNQRMEKGSFKLARVLLALFSLITTTASGGLTCNGEKDCKFSPDGQCCTVKFNRDHKCCDVDCLLGDYIASFAPGSLTIDAEYTAPHQANIIARWQYIKGREPVNTIQIALVQGDKRTCLCLPPNVTQFKTDVWDPPRPCHNPDTLNISVQLQLRDPIDSVKHMRKEITLHKCWSTMGNQSHEVCGPKIPSSPLNALVIAMEDHNGTSQVVVTWRPPSEEFTAVVSYFLELIYTDDAKEWQPIKAITKVVPRNVSTYTFHGLSVTDADRAYVLVRAGVVEGAHPCICCITTSQDGNNIMYGYPANATVQWPSLPSVLHTAIIAAPAAAGVLLVLVVVSMATCSVYWARRRIVHKSSSHGQVKHSVKALDRQRLLPWFANVTNGDNV